MLWKLSYPDSVVEGRSRIKWDSSPTTGVQVLLKALDPEQAGKSRVGWHNQDEIMRELSPTKGLWEGCNFYAYLKDGPSGVTPDTILDLWHQLTGDSSVTVGDLSLDDLRKIHVKIGRSLPDDEFAVILQAAINDPAFP